MSSWRIGAVSITRIIEKIDTFPPGLMLPGVTNESVLAHDWLRPDYVTEDGRINLAIQALVVEAPGRLIVVDTCVGNEREGRGNPGWNNLQTRFLQDFAAAGFDRLKVDTVFCTHLHADHVGWNTMKVGDAWVPTFPNARYLMNRKEFEHWAAMREDPRLSPVFTDSIAPIEAAGLFDLIDLDHDLTPELTLISTPGHTPGHASVRIRSRGEEGMISGDFIHHPCQMAKPEGPQGADSDRALAAQTRRATLEALARTKTLLVGTHFPPPTAGYVERENHAFRFRSQDR